MVKKNCLFCNIDAIRNDILWESQNFFIKVGVGILAPGHVMLLPKRHVSCFAELPENLRGEFIVLKRAIFKKIKSNFSEPIIYEHAIYGQSIKHAHIHFVPNRSNYYNIGNIKENAFKNLESIGIKNMFEIRKIFKKEGSYFYLEEKGKKWVFHTKNQPEGKFTFRKEFARLTDLHGLTKWQTMPEEEKQRNQLWVNSTKDLLKDAKLPIH